MITWMQRHKKWLVITIWISTIAFIGAGFVGWGSYDYGKKGGAVAVVGDREISIEEYQQEYSNMYEQYAKLFGSAFNDEMAKRLNLKDMAYNQVLQKNLILAYADSLGLDVTNEDIVKELVKYNAFLKDGKFDKETYVKVLNQNRTTPALFEASLKRNILLQKIQLLFELEPSKTEIENINKLLFLEDDIVYKIITSDDITVQMKDDELKKYWEENKNNYKSEISFDLEITKIPLISSNPSEEEIQTNYDKFRTDYKKEDGKIKTLEEAKADIIKSLDEKLTKTEALKRYLKVKKGEENLENKISYLASTLPFDAQTNAKIVETKADEVVKPFLFNNEYVIVKLAKKNESQVLSFEKALKDVKDDFTKVLKEKKLSEVASNELKDLNGTKVSKVTRETVDKIEGLEAQEAAKFLNELFSSTSKEGSVKLNDKIVVFKILDSRFAQYDKSKDEIVKSTLLQMQDQELMTNLVKRLENRYEIQTSIQTKEQ